MTKQNAIYVRVPKTGSTSLVEMVRPYSHVKYNRRDKILPSPRVNCLSQAHRAELGADVWNASFSFLFVRNPYERCVSSWRHLEPELEFPAFVDLLPDYNLGQRKLFDYNSWHCCLQTPHVVDENGEIMVSLVGRFEQLQDDFDRICKLTGMPLRQLPHRRRTDHAHYSEYYDAATRQAVGDIYRLDIEQFNYSFETDETEQHS
jgi:hypothetical protein